jgi:hypothetical protein
MNKTKTFISFLTSILISMIAIVTFFFFLNIIKNKNEHTSKLNLTLEDKMVKKENLNDLLKKFTEIEKTNEVVNSYFVNSSRVDLFVEYLENLGTTHGVQIKVEGIEVVPDSKNLSVNLSAKGSFNNVMKITALLENAPFDLGIKEVYLNKMIENQSVQDGENNTSSPNLWEANITFNILTIS